MYRLRKHGTAAAFREYALKKVRQRKPLRIKTEDSTSTVHALRLQIWQYVHEDGDEIFLMHCLDEAGNRLSGMSARALIKNEELTFALSDFRSADDVVPT